MLSLLNSTASPPDRRRISCGDLSDWSLSTVHTIEAPAGCLRPLGGEDYGARRSEMVFAGGSSFSVSVTSLPLDVSVQLPVWAPIVNTTVVPL
jgi:hypothetical protein